MILPHKVRSGEPIRAETINAIIDAIADLQRISSGVRIPTLKRASDGRKSKSEPRPFTVSILGYCKSCGKVSYCLNINRGALYKRSLIPCASISNSEVYTDAFLQDMVVKHDVKHYSYAYPFVIERCDHHKTIWFNLCNYKFYTGPTSYDYNDSFLCGFWCKWRHVCCYDKLVWCDDGTSEVRVFKCTFEYRYARPMLRIATIKYSDCKPKICQYWNSDIFFAHLPCYSVWPVNIYCGLPSKSTLHPIICMCYGNSTE